MILPSLSVSDVANHLKTHDSPGNSHLTKVRLMKTNKVAGMTVPRMKALLNTDEMTVRMLLTAILLSDASVRFAIRRYARTWVDRLTIITLGFSLLCLSSLLKSMTLTIPSPISWDRVTSRRTTITQANRLRACLRQLISDQAFADIFIIPQSLSGCFLEHLFVLLSG